MSDDAPAFAEATAVTAIGNGAYEADCSTAWSAPNGPNGGYLAAIVLRAVLAEVGDPAYVPRSLTCHFQRPPADGPVRVEAVVQRRGRTAAFAAARLSQGDRLCVTAQAACVVAGDAPSWAPAMPEVPAPEAVEPWPAHPRMPPISHRLELRHCLGPPAFSGAGEAVSGGWMGLRAGPEPIDAPLLALLADGWMPVVFPRLERPAAAPTIDLTVHFRHAGTAAGERVLGVFRNALSAGGVFEEDGELWSEDGVLLAQSRQLALLR